MNWLFRSASAAALSMALVIPAAAQQARPSTPARDALRPLEGREARMLITVVDQTNAVIPGATVTVTGTEPLTEKAAHPSVQTTRPGWRPSPV